MKKMIYIILGIIAASFVGGLVLAVWLAYHPQSLKITNDKNFSFGPYSCNGKSLTIEQTFRINSLEGASSLADITVTYGDNLVFKQAYTFKDTIEQKTGKSLISSGGLLYESDQWKEGGVDYLSGTQKSVTLPSQEELISRGKKPDEKGMIILGSTSNASEDDLKAFAECFSQNKKLIYDEETNGSYGNPPYFLWYYKAYLIKI